MSALAYLCLNPHSVLGVTLEKPAIRLCAAELNVSAR